MHEVQMMRILHTITWKREQIVQDQGENVLEKPGHSNEKHEQTL